LEKLAETIQNVGFGDRDSNLQTLGEHPVVVNAAIAPLLFSVTAESRDRIRTIRALLAEKFPEGSD
jgi:hypothetical protein